MLHKLQKKYVSEGEYKDDVSSINSALQEWSETFVKEEIKALYGQGNYRLAPGYDHFYVESTKWFKWSQERKDQHIRVLREFVPNIAETYKKPKNTDLKGNEKNKKRRDGKEPVLFVNQFENPDLDLLFDPEMLP